MSKYNKKFYQIQQDSSYQSAKIILPYVFNTIFPDNKTEKRVVDFGCGVGTWLKAAKEEGATQIKGIDAGSIQKEMLFIEAEDFISTDLTQKLDLDFGYDLAISLEVAEHIPEEASDTFIDNLCKASKVILFSAAIPGQGGTGHINEQPLSYWVKKFEMKGYQLFDCVRHRFWNEERVGTVYRQNAVLFLHNTLQQAPITGERPLLDVVHPKLYETMVKRNSQYLISPLFVSTHFPRLYDYMRKNMRKLLRE